MKPSPKTEDQIELRGYNWGYSAAISDAMRHMRELDERADLGQREYREALRKRLQRQLIWRMDK
jgi:hypothetical protein